MPPQGTRWELSFCEGMEEKPRLLLRVAILPRDFCPDQIAQRNMILKWTGHNPFYSPFLISGLAICSVIYILFQYTNRTSAGDLPNHVLPRPGRRPHDAIDPL
jgi:hypothetical protein